MDIENIIIVKSRRTLRGVGYEPEARAGLNPEPGTAQLRINLPSISELFTFPPNFLMIAIAASNPL